jgi:hypothetical protein
MVTSRLHPKAMSTQPTPSDTLQLIFAPESIFSLVHHTISIPFRLTELVHRPVKVGGTAWHGCKRGNNFPCFLRTLLLHCRRRHCRRRSLFHCTKHISAFSSRQRLQHIAANIGISLRNHKILKITEGETLSVE